MDDRDWQAEAKSLVRRELQRRNLTYHDLAERLRAIGIDIADHTVANRIGRGSFSAAFLLQCMAALGVRDLRL